MSLLRVEQLSVYFDTPEGRVAAVAGIDFALEEGQSLAIVGESGSGKSQTAYAMMGLLDSNGAASGSVKLHGKEILNMPAAQLNKIRAEQMAMVFQDAMTSLNPYMRVSSQMAETLMFHRGMSKKDAVQAAIEMLDMVRIPEPKRRVHMYPHEFSGGMRQRVMIAMSLLCEPQLLIADEPTTALDVTVQDQIMELLQTLQKQLHMALILITHDLGVVASSCEHTLVLYGGQVMEEGTTNDIFAKPTHPYTMGLLRAIPQLDTQAKELIAIPGSPPNMMDMPTGCPFSPRCQFADDACTLTRPVLTASGNRKRACFKPIEQLV